MVGGRRSTIDQRLPLDDAWPAKQTLMLAHVHDISATNTRDTDKEHNLIVRLGYARQSFETRTLTVRSKRAAVGEQSLFWLKDVEQKMKDTESTLDYDWSIVCSLIEVDG